MEESQQINILAQYIKDLSVDVDYKTVINASTNGYAANAMENNSDVEYKEMGDNKYEVTFRVDLTLKVGNNRFAGISVEYAAIFESIFANNEIKNIFLYVEMPKMLFPFIRSLIAFITSNAGMAPIMLDQVDLLKIYEQKTGIKI